MNKVELGQREEPQPASSGRLTRLQALRVAYVQNRRIITGAFGLLFAKSISMVTLILTVPLALHQLGPEQFGIWMTLTSLASLLSTADFGVGNGIMTELAKKSGEVQNSDLSSIVTNGLATLILLCTVMSIGFLLIFPWIDPTYLFGHLGTASRSQAKLAMLIFFASSFVSIPAMLGQRMMIGLQLGWWSGIWAGIGSVAALATLLIAVTFGAGLSVMMLAFVGSPVLVLTVATTWVLLKHPSIKIRFELINIGEINRLARQGTRFFVLTLIYAGTFTTDNLVIAHVLGTHAVALYSISDRLFQIIAVALTMISAPLWPAYADAYARKRFSWVIATFKRSILLNVALGGFGALVLIGMSSWIFPLWLGSAISPPLALISWIAARRLMEAIYTACNNMLNALEIVKIQLLFGAAMALSSIILRYVMATYFGINGIPVAVIIGVILFGLAPTLIALQRLRAYARAS